MGARLGCGTNDEDEAIATAWSRYRDNSEEGANELLRALDPVLVRAVRKWGERALGRCYWLEVAQEVRLRIVPRRFLLKSPALEALATPPGEASAQRKDAIVQTIKNIVYMVTYWETMELAEKLWRQNEQYAETELDEIAQEPASESFDVEGRMAHLQFCLREQGYSATECAHFVSYLEGAINQGELGQCLGIQQPATSKRLQKLRDRLAAGNTTEQG